MSAFYWWMSLLLFAKCTTTIFAMKREECGACMMVVEELEHAIGLVDPRKKIKVGSFRVNPNGDQQGLNEIPFARSETHIHELLENVCDKSSDYALVTHLGTGKKVYVRTKDWENVNYKLSNADSSSSIRAKLNSACHSLLDDHEDDLIKFLSTANDQPTMQFCHKSVEICTAVDIIPFPYEVEESETHEAEKDTGPESDNDESSDQFENDEL